jgi:hypothetical protein
VAAWLPSRPCGGNVAASFRVFIHHRLAGFATRSDSLPSDLTNGLFNRLRDDGLYRIAGVIANLKFVVPALLKCI